MKIHEIIWPDEQVEHIRLHDINPIEVEDVCFGKALILRAKSTGKIQFIMRLGKQKLDDIYFVLS